MHGGVRRFWMGALATSLTLLAAQNSFAATHEQQRCEGKEAASTDLRITSCTAVIEQTQVNKEKSDAFINRGKAYRAKGDSDRAIRDFDEAILIDSKDGEAFYNRGLAFRDRGETDRGGLAARRRRRRRGAPESVHHGGLRALRSGPRRTRPRDLSSGARRGRGVSGGCTGA